MRGVNIARVSLTKRPPSVERCHSGRVAVVPQSRTRDDRRSSTHVRRSTDMDQKRQRAAADVASPRRAIFKCLPSIVRRTMDVSMCAKTPAASRRPKSIQQRASANEWTAANRGEKFNANYCWDWKTPHNGLVTRVYGLLCVCLHIGGRSYCDFVLCMYRGGNLAGNCHSTITNC